MGVTAHGVKAELLQGIGALVLATLLRKAVMLVFVSTDVLVGDEAARLLILQQRDGRDEGQASVVVDVKTLKSRTKDEIEAIAGKIESYCESNLAVGNVHRLVALIKEPTERRKKCSP